MPEQTKSRADRLQDVLRTHAPRAVAYHDEHRAWPTPADIEEEGVAETPKDRAARLAAKIQRDDKIDAEKAQERAQDAVRSKQNAPYVIKTLRSGRTLILVTKDDGTQIAGTGDDIEAAIAALEQIGGAR